MPSSSAYQYFMFPAGTDPRFLQTALWTPSRRYDSQQHPVSGSYYASAVTNQREHAEFAVEAAVDLGDLVFALAGLYQNSFAGGDWEFAEYAGLIDSNMDERKTFNKIMAFNFEGPASGPTYEADEPTLNSLELMTTRGGNSLMRQQWLTKQLSDVTPPATAPAAPTRDVNVVRNSEFRTLISAGRLGELTEPDTVLSSRITYSELVRLVWAENQTTRGWTRTVKRKIQPMIEIMFEADDSYVDYTDPDATIFIEIADTDGDFSWIHRCRPVIIPQGPGDDGDDLQAVTVRFAPIAQVYPGALATSTITFTNGDDGASPVVEKGYRSGSGGFGTLVSEVGNILDALTEVIYTDPASGDDTIHIGKSDDWPVAFEPESVAVGSTTYPLTYDATDKIWVSDGISPAITDFDAGNAAVTINYKWTPSHLATAFINNSGVATF